MDNNNTPGMEDPAGLLQQISSLLKLTLPDIKDRCADYRHRIIRYFERDISEESLEILFDQEGFTITCSFNTAGNCNIIHLFPDDNRTIEMFIPFLNKSYIYNFITGKWTVGEHSVRIRTLTYPPYDPYMVFYG